MIIQKILLQLLQLVSTVKDTDAAAKIFYKKNKKSIDNSFVIWYNVYVNNSRGGNDMLVNYNEVLKTARKYGIDPIMLTVATEMEDVKYDLLNKTMNEKEFELCCSLVEDAYLKAENITINQLVKALSDILEREEKSIEEIVTSISLEFLIAEACWYD